MVSLKRYRCLAWDWDDTLVETRKAKWEHHRFVARTYYGIELSDADLAQHWGKAFHDMLLLLYRTDNLEEALRNCQAHRGEYPKRIFADTPRLLKEIRQSGRPSALITSTSSESLGHDFRDFNLVPGIFRFMQTMCDWPHHKPDPKVFEPLLVWAKSRGILPEEIVYIGDGLHDMRAAQGAGIDFLGVCTGIVSAEEFAKHGAQSVLSIRELLPLL